MRGRGASACCGAVARQLRFGNAQLTTFARIHAGRLLSARLANGRVIKLACGARRGEHDRRRRAVRAWDRTTAKTVAAIGRLLSACIDALLALRRAVLERRIVGAACSSGVFRVAFQVPITAVIALTAVAIKKAILFARINVVAADPRGETSLVVIERYGTFRVLPIGQAIAVVV